MIRGAILGPRSSSARVEIAPGAVIGRGARVVPGAAVERLAPVQPGEVVEAEVARERLDEIRAVDRARARRRPRLPDHLRDALWRVESAGLEPRRRAG